MDKQNESIYERTELMLGNDAVKRLKDAKICVVGVGGVGGFAAEALARASGSVVVFEISDTRNLVGSSLLPAPIAEIILHPLALASLIRSTFELTKSMQSST